MLCLLFMYMNSEEYYLDQQ